MDSTKTTLRKLTNLKPKPSNSNTNTTLTTRQSVKDLESQAKQSPSSSKRGPKRKLQVPMQSNVKRSCLRSNKEKQRMHHINAQKITKKAKEKSSKIDIAGDESSDDPFTEEEEEETVLRVARDQDKAPSKNNINTKSQLNGDKNPVFYTSPRVRKPNPKFQDFITSPQVRSITNTEKQTKEKSETPKIKIKQKGKGSPAVPVEKDPLDIVNMKPDSDGKEDEIVRSFLPIMDKPKVLYDLEGEAFGIVKSGKSKLSSAKIDNAVLPSVKETVTANESEKSTNASKPDVSDNVTLPSDITPLDSTTSAVTPVTITPENVTPNSSIVIPVSNANTNESKVKTNATNNASYQKKANNHNVRKYTRIPIERKRKGAFIDTKKKEEIRYCLIDGEGVSYRTKSPKTSDVDFNKLVRTLKSVKLPASNWKIRIVVSRQQTITEVTFTNKEANERCVKFSRVFTGYVITFGKSVVKLVGAPNKISSFNDVTILLDIIHNLSLNDPILQYVADKDK